MALKSGDQDLQSMGSLKLEAHILGKKTGRLGEHGLVDSSRRAVAFTYDAALQADTRDLFRAESSLCKAEVNRFAHIHQGTDDLINKVKIQRHCGAATGGIILTKLVHDLLRMGGEFGLAAMCIGGGQGVAVVARNVA